MRWCVNTSHLRYISIYKKGGVISTINVSQLLGDVAVAVGRVRAARNHFADRLAPDFTIFDYLRSDEMGLSNCIAGLLDPRGSHGQGGIFLDSFFSVLLDQKEWKPNYENCTVVTEKQANGMRRIDIVLHFSDAIVGIENKPWAGDPDGQLSDYGAYLKSESPTKKWILVYLCDRDPSEESLREATRKTYQEGHNFIHCSFEQVESWLDQCSKNTKALPVRVFIEELSKFVRMRVRKVLDMSEERETTAIIRHTPAYLESAFDVFNSVAPVKIELLNNFRKELEVELKAKDFHLVWDESMPMRSMSNSGFGVKFFERQSIYLRFEFESSGLNGLFWGLKSESKAAPHEVAKWADINNLMSIRFGSGGSPTTGAWWLWFRTDTKNHLGLDRNWYNNFQPWSQLMSGMTKDKSVASHIASLACDVQIALGDGVAKLLPEH